jgi:hypothetical protein
VRAVVDDGVQYHSICVTGGMGSLAPGSLLTRGIASFARAVERGSDRFKAVLRTSDPSLAAEWIAVLRTVCGRQRAQGIERLQCAIAAGEVQSAIHMAEDLASLSAAVPGRIGRTPSFGPSSGRASSPRADGVDASSARSSGGGGGGGGGWAGGSGGSRYVEVPARPHRMQSLSSDDGFSEGESVHEVSVVLHPVGPDGRSEKRKLREELQRCRQQLGQQRKALQIAHAALQPLANSGGGAGGAVAEAAEAVAAALRETSVVDSPSLVAADVVARAEMSPPGSAHIHASGPPLAPLPVSALAAAEAAVAKAAAEARAESRAEAAARSKANAEPASAAAVPIVPSEPLASSQTAATAAAAAAAAAAPAAPPPSEGSAASTVGTPDPEAEEAARTGKPRAGFTTAPFPSLEIANGDGTEFDLRMLGYMSHKKKEQSAFHIWEPLRIDVIKRRAALFHVASKLTLPPPPDGASTPNASGLPRRLIINTIIPAEAPSLLGGYDGLCYQIVIVFGASAERLQRWVDEGSGAAKLFQRFFADAPEGVLPSSGDTDIKERLKLLPKVDNMKSLGLSVVEKYNGKPALLTKSGSIHRGDDYIELGMNTFRFGYITKKGVSTIFHKIKDMDFHAAITLEGRKDEELPEQVLCAVRIKNMDLTAIAPEVDEALGD